MTIHILDAEKVGAALLELHNRGDRRVTAADVAYHAKVPTGAAQRALNTLARAGLANLIRVSPGSVVWLPSRMLRDAANPPARWRAGDQLYHRLERTIWTVAWCEHGRVGLLGLPANREAPVWVFRMDRLASDMQHAVALRECAMRSGANFSKAIAGK